MGETDPRVEIVNRLERAAMAYERLGKLTRDDDKTRDMRKATIAELADARRAILAALDATRPAEPPADEDVAGLVERLRDEGARGARDSQAAATTIERQQAEIARLTKAMEDMIEAQEIRARSILQQTARATAAEAEVARLTRERDEARALHDACALARDSVGYLGTVADCIEDLHQRATAAEAEVADLRARLAAFLAHADQSPTSVARGVGGMTVDANMRGTRVHVSQWEVEELRTALAAPEEAGQ